MSEWYFLFFAASWIAVFSIPIILCTVLMRVVGRIGTRTLVLVLAVDLIFWAMATSFWWMEARRGEWMP